VIARLSIVIEPGRAARNYWRDLWQYRELLYVLAWRDLAVRYKQTAIGVSWAVLRPALTLLAFVAFRRIAGIQRADVPDAIVVFAAVLPWQFFATALTESAGSMIGNAQLISKVYFPRLIVPGASVVTSLVDLLISLALLAGLFAWYGFAPGWQLAALPLFVALAFALSLGTGLFFAALNVWYRDFRYVVPFIVQFGIFVSPVAFTTADVPAAWRPMYSLNPMVGVIDGFRWAILGEFSPIDPVTIVVSAVMTAVLLLLGVRLFRRMERGFADVI
jgi:lipopolysaccharide transport system permease protein